MRSALAQAAAREDQLVGAGSASPWSGVRGDSTGETNPAVLRAARHARALRDHRYGRVLDAGGCQEPDMMGLVGPVGIEPATDGL
jgi:hypothetical protein